MIFLKAHDQEPYRVDGARFPSLPANRNELCEGDQHICCLLVRRREKCQEEEAEVCLLHSLRWRVKGLIGKERQLWEKLMRVYSWPKLQLQLQGGKLETPVLREGQSKTQLWEEG